MIILGRHDGKREDEFAMSFYNQIREHKEGISYHRYELRYFSNDESRIRFADKNPNHNPREKISSNNKLFLPGSEEIRNAIKKDPHVALVMRSSSGWKRRPGNLVLDTYFGCKKLKKEMGVEQITLILPDIPYGKEDHLFYDHDTDELIDGAPITLKYERELLRECADLLIHFNPHDYRDRTGWVKKDETTIPGATRDSNGRILDERGRVILPEAEDWTGFAYAIDAMPTLAEYIIKISPNPLFIGPDRTIENAIRKISPKVLIADKVRDRYESLNTNSEIELSEDMRGYDAILLDDRIGAGTTMNGVIEKLIEYIHSPRSITCGAVNAEFAQNRKLGKSALNILKENEQNPKGIPVKIVATNTVDIPRRYVDIVKVEFLLVKELLGEELYKIVFS